MTGRLVVVPLRRDILMRSVGYGAGWGAAIGAVVAALPAGLASPYAIGLLIVMPIAATVGAIFGFACGLAGGLGLIILRRHLAAGGGAVRVVAGSGAGLVPAACMAVVMAGSGRPWLPAIAALTAATATIAAALGPFAFFGRPRRRRRRIGHPNDLGERREIVG